MTGGSSVANAVKTSALHEDRMERVECGSHAVCTFPTIFPTHFSPDKGPKFGGVERVKADSSELRSRDPPGGGFSFPRNG